MNDTNSPTQKRTRNKLRKQQQNKSSKHINSGKGLYSDIKNWSGLYLEELKARCENGEIAPSTVRSYKFTINAMDSFTYKDYNTKDNLSDIDEVYINDFLQWLEYESFTNRYGSDEYMSDVINDFLDYYEENGSDVIDIEVLLLQYIAKNNDRKDMPSIINIIEYCLNEYLYEQKITDYSLIDDKVIEACIKALKERDKIKKSSTLTMVQRKATVTAFFTFISITNIEKEDTTRHFKYLKKYVNKGKQTKEHKRKKGYTDKKQMQKIDIALREHYDAVERNKRAYSKSYYCALRDSTLALIMMYGGLRASEAIKLRFEDIVKTDDTYSVEILGGKGNKSRFSSIYAPLIEDELAELKSISKHDTLSATSSGNIMAYSSLYKSIKKILEKLDGIDFNGLHAFRHTFATEMAKSGDVAVVAELLGHSNLKTTQIYINISNDRKTKIVSDIQKKMVG
jgi:integrase